ncbi:nitrate/nitrite transporter NrtS [Oscillatoria sp. FACHB-1406]|uniref:nitrate/nitrite transporter NrtS n=1 Tax=Oscillatoria sp. FACHB-1406 TaxID=2692846 RepID=UPI00168205A5|nr:nitrate/nitrite transporter NrtS [Oscillatoria sp. FACHB-1406]MBD2577664.1 nitrate/nitrite transporter NrtS [Oscillatoria sp. FACHB-1406]
MVLWHNLFDVRFSWTAIRVALLVGTILFVINHGRAFLDGTMNRERWISAAFTYCVPYIVSIHGQSISQARIKAYSGSSDLAKSDRDSL